MSVEKNQLRVSQARPRTGLALSLLLAAAVSGCANSSQWNRSAWRGFDSQAPLGAQRVETRRPPAPPAKANESAASPERPPRQLPGAGDRLEAPDPRPLPLPRLSSPEPDEIPSDAGIELLVEAPRRKQVDSHATYRLTVRNTSDQSLADVLVQCRFDDPLVCAGVSDRFLQRRIERLLPGESKELAISLTSSEAGLHACRFTVMAGSPQAEAATEIVTVEFVSRQLQLEMWGPTQRTVESRAEFTVMLLNQSPRTLSDVRAILSYDKALEPKVATAGKREEPGRLIWNLGTLNPGEMISLHAEFECKSKARRACVSLEVLAEEITSEHEEACLEIIPVPGTLDLRLSDREETLEVGKKGIYEATVRNIGMQSARGIALEAELPPELKFVSATVVNGRTQMQVKSHVEGNRVIFSPVDELAADAVLTYRLEVEAIRAGAIELRVGLTSALGRTPVTTTEPTVIFDPRDYPVVER